MKTIVKKCALLGFIVLFLAGIPLQAVLASPGDDHGLEKTVDGTTVELVLKPEQVKTGSSSVLVRLSDGHHEPLQEARVWLTLVPHDEDESDHHGDSQPEAASSDDHQDEDKPADGGHTDSGQEAGGHGEDNEGAAAHTDTGGHAEDKEDSHTSEDSGHHDDDAAIELQAGHIPGEYEGTVNFPEEGVWVVHVNFSASGVENTASFPVEVLPGGGPWLLLGGFFGVNTAVVVSAAVLKRRSKVSTQEKSG